MASLASQKSAASSPNRTQVDRRPLPANFIEFGQWREYRTAQEKALHENPELAKEYQEILKEMGDQQKNLDAAMIKEDPSVALIMTKLEALRHANSGTNVSSAK
jgi:hypothetical protein